MSANKIGRLSGFKMAAAALLAGASAAQAQVDHQIPLNYNWHGMAQPGETFYSATSANADLLTNKFRALQDRGLVYDLGDPNALGTLPMLGAGGITYSLFDSLGYANTTWPGAAANGYDLILLYNKLLNGTTPEFFTNPSSQPGPFPPWAPQATVTGFAVTAGLAATSPSLITVETSAPHGLPAGNMVVIGGANPAVLNGTFNILSVPDPTHFTILNPNTNTNGSAQAYANNVPGSASVTATTLTFTAGAGNAHGLAVGNTVALSGINAAGAGTAFNSPAYTGSFTVATVTSPTVFTVTLPSNQGTAASRMRFSTGGTPYQLNTVTANGKTVTATTAQAQSTTATGLNGSGTTVTATFSTAHSYTTGQTVVITGAVPTGFNGTYVVTGTPSATTLTYANTTVGASTTAGAFTSAHGLSTGASVTVSGVNPLSLNGTYTVTVPSATLASIDSVTTTATATTATAHPFSSGQVLHISGADVPAHNGRFTITVPSATIRYLSGSGSVVTATTGAAHSFVTGQLVHVSGAFPGAFNGTFTIASVPSTTTFTFASAATGAFRGASTSVTATAANTFTYTIPSTAGTSSNAGIDAFTPSVFTYSLVPQGTMVAKHAAHGGFGFALNSLQGDGATVTAATGTIAHNLIVGDSITISNVAPASYNGTFTITSVPSTTTFRYADTNTAPTKGTAIGAGTLERASIDNTTVLSTPVTVDANTQVGVLYLESNGVGNFDTVLTFNNGMTDTNFTARLQGPDWCGNNADAAILAGNPIVSQTKLLHPLSARVASLAGDGFTVTADTGVPHGFLVGDTVDISGDTSGFGYNGTYTVASTPAQTTSTIAIGGLVGSAGTATATTAAAHGLTSGQAVFISGAIPYTFNGVFVITVTGASTFTYANATVGTNTVAGSAVRNTFTFSGAGMGTSAGTIFAKRSGGVASNSFRGVQNTDSAQTGAFGTGVPPTPSGCANLGVNEGVIAIPAGFTGQQLTKITFNNASWGNQAINSIVGNGTHALVTTAAAHGLIVGQTFNITGSTPATYNGIYQVSSMPSTTTFTYATTETAVSSGTRLLQRPGVGKGYSIHAATARTGIANQANASCATPMLVTTSGNVANVATNNFASGASPAVVTANDTTAVWFEYTAPFGGVPVLINTCTGQLDSTIAVYTSCGGLVATSNDDFPACGTGGSQVHFVSSSSQTYLIRVAGKNGAKGLFTLHIEDFPAPANGLPTSAQTAFAGTGIAGDTAGTVASAFDGFTTATGGGSDRYGVWYSFTVGGVGAHQCEARTCLDGQDLTLTPEPQKTGVTGVRTVSVASAVPVLPLDSTIAVYSGSPASPVFIAGNDDGCSVSSRVRWTGTPGVTYLIRVASKTPQSGTNAQFILHVDDPVHTDLVMPMQFNWNGICHGTTTTGPLISEQTVPNTAAPVIGQIHENRSDLNGFRSIADRGLLFDPNNAVQNALNFGATVGYQGMVYQMYDTALQSDMIHVGNRNQTGGGGGRPWSAPGTTWPAQGGTATSENGLKPIWIGDDDQRGEQISSMTGLGATFGPDTQIGLLYHVSNVGQQSGTTPFPCSFDITLRFADASSVIVKGTSTDWFGGQSAVPYNLILPTPSTGEGKVAQRVLGIYRGVETTDFGNFATTGPLKVQELVISTQELINMGFDPQGRGVLQSISFGNVVSGVLQPATNPPTPASVSITGNGTTATATFTWPVAANAAQKKMFFPGYNIIVANATDGTFNGSFKILSVPSETSVTFQCPGVGTVTGCNITTLDNYTSAVGIYAATLRDPATFNLNFPPSGAGTLLPNMVNLRSSGLLRVTTSRGSGSPNNITVVTVDASSLYGHAPGTDIISLNDSGSNGDALANDNAWSRTLDLLVGTIPGAKVLPFTVTDAQNRAATGNVIFTIVPPVAAITPSDRVFPGDSASVTVNIGANPAPLGPSSNIVSIALNLGPLSGGMVVLNDGATNGDISALDGIWSANFSIPSGATPGVYDVVYTYTDASARVGTGTIPLVVHRDLGTITHGASPNLYQQTYDQLPGGVRWFRFTLASQLSPTEYVDIDTEGTNWTPTNATFAALFDASGGLIVTDTIDGTDALSQLTFGNNIVARPPPGNGLAYNGRDGNLVAGTYYLAVTGAGAVVTPPFGVTTTSTSTGPTTVRIVFGEAQFTSGTPTFNLHDFGTIPIGPAGNPTVVSHTDFLQIGNVRWYRFTTAAIAAADRTFIDIDTEGSAVTDTIIAIFRDDGNGSLVATDNDDGSGSYSQFSFGIGTRLPVGDGVAYNGRDGAATITAGTYYVCVAENPASFGTNFAVGALNGITTGNVTLTIRSGAQSRTLCGPITGNPDRPTDSYYLVDTLGMNWVTAEAYAVSQYGGHLVTIGSSSDNQWVYDNVASCGGTHLCWIGLSDPSHSASIDLAQRPFVWADGTSFDSGTSFQNWALGEPNNGPAAAPPFSEWYIEMAAATGFWNDVLENAGSTANHYSIVQVQPGAGACYTPSGGCAIVSAGTCTTLGGNFQGASTTCPVSGACCTGAVCAIKLNVGTFGCTATSGIYRGDATTCSGANLCTGACCTLGNCVLDVLAADCTLGGGVYQGNGTNCDSNNYPQPTASTLPLEDISGTGAPFALTNGTQDDGNQMGISIGFSFSFYGNPETTVNIQTNGYIFFGATSFLGTTPGAIPTAAAPTNLIAVHGMDMGATAPFTAPITYEMRGTAPFRRFIVQWTNDPRYNNLGSNTFQIILYETANVIAMRYGTLNAGGSTTIPTVGVENATGTFGTNSAIPIASNTALVWQPPSPVCSGAPITGACNTGSSCSVVSYAQCLGLDGVYLGDATTCPNNGACCTAGVCSITTSATCAPGTFQGTGTVCLPNPCPPPTGACCVAGACSQVAQASCTGFFAGVGAACTPNICPVCCRGSTCNSSIYSAAACTATGTAGAIFVVGPTAACGGVNHLQPCCHADFNKIGGRNVNDIFAYLTAWFSGSRLAKVGGNGDPAGPAPLVGDIFAFLTDWFAGGCP